MSKKKISIICGTLANPRQLQVFEALQGDFNINVYAIESRNLLAGGFPQSLKLFLFENIADMPGYMRSLEDHVSDSDCLIILETSRLASFQGVRIARKYNIPCVALVNEFHPYFYNDYPNIRAVQMDIFEHADRFWATSKLAEQMLTTEEVSCDRIKLIPLAVNRQVFSQDDRGRHRFRKYVGIDDDEFVILFRGELEKWMQPSMIIDSLKLLNSTKPAIGKKTRLIYVGDGSCAKELKYRCYDENLGTQVMFLHQNPEPFVQDLYNACDVLISLRRQRSDFHEEFPIDVLEAIACGVIPIFSLGTVVAEYTEGVGIGIADDNHKEIAVALGKLLNDEVLETQRQKIKGLLDVNAVAKVADLYRTELLNLVGNRSAVPRDCDFRQLILSLDQQIEHGKAAEALARTEEVLLTNKPDHILRSELCRVKADALAGLNQLDASVDAYNESLQFDRSNYKSYRGLGYIALKGHSNEEAYTFFRKSLASKDGDFQSMLGLALAQKRLGWEEQALFWLEKCVHIDKSHYGALAALIQLCHESPHTDEAIAALTRVVEHTDQKNPSVLMTLGQLYLREGDSKTGNFYIEKALAMESLQKAS